jgi:predicted Zn-ribbon and HTH transcriptional regulator
MKRNHTCGYCEELFPNASEHMIHVSLEHAGATTYRRPISCWHCAHEFVPATGTDPGPCPKCGTRVWSAQRV